MVTKKYATSKTNEKKNTRRKKTTSRKSRMPRRKTKSLSPQRKTSTKLSKGSHLKIIVLGGLEEVGRNMTLMEYDGEIILIDMGLQFPEESMPGIDYIIPNVEYLRGREKDIKGVIITHGHYDHIGAISHIMPKIGNPPMYTGAMSAGIIERRHAEYRNLEKLNITRVTEHSKLQLGKNFEISFVHVNHTIPDTFAVVVKTPAGSVIHTGDFKLDFNPIGEKPADFTKFHKLGDEGILALMCDSTSAALPGHQISESVVAEEMEKIFQDAKGRIIIGTFASLLSRIQIVLSLAEQYGKKVAIEGRSMQSNIEVAHELGYFKYKPGTIIESADAAKLPDHKVVIVGTGAQAQENAFLMRYATDEHKFLTVKKGDIVIFSSSVIPGNERTIQSLKDTLWRKGARVIHSDMVDIHAGGHAKEEEVKMLIRATKPKFFIPIEQYHFMLRMNAEVAESTGMVDPKNIFIADNGQVMEFDNKGNGKLTKDYVPAEYVFVDGLGVGDVSEIVLRDRQMLAADGMMVVIAQVDGKTGALVGSPDIISRGFVYLKENKSLIEQTRNKVRKALKDTDKKSGPDEMYLKNKLRAEIGQFLWAKTKRRPMVLPVVITV